MDRQTVQDIINRMLLYSRGEDWAGYDPFDGLNSQVFILKGNRLCRQAWLQFHKRSPINFRGIAAVGKERNPKGVGLFVSGLINIYRSNSEKTYLSTAKDLLGWLKNQSVNGGWGYNFAWQSRSFYVPKNTPNMIATVFVGNAFLDAFEVTEDFEYYQLAHKASDFILKKLNTHEEDGLICFSYTPLDGTRVHNVNLLGAAFLARMYTFTNEPILIDKAEKAVGFALKHQNNNGSWYYGLDENQRWIDGFHTGYNLVALHTYMKYARDSVPKQAVEKGYGYYKNHLFGDGFVPKYYPNGQYPIDIHNISQAMITFSEFGERELAQKAAGWAIENMWDDQGYFYFQKGRFITNKIPYMRWSQAWMFYALSKLLDYSDKKE